jgi:hypothetical protein
MSPSKPLYVIVRCDHLLKLQAEVDAKMREGYVLAGSLVVEYAMTPITRVTSDSRGTRTRTVLVRETWYAQAMVLKS